MNFTKQKVHVSSQYSKISRKQPLKNDKTKILLTFGSLMKVERIAECSLIISDNWSSFLSGPLRQGLLYNQQSIYIYAYKCLCRCVGKVYYPNVNMLGPIISENDPPLKPCIISKDELTFY